MILLAWKIYMKSVGVMVYSKNSQIHAHRKSVIKSFIWFLFFAVLIILFYRCPFKMITGIDCPGCGLTRAFGCILLCDFSAAVQYHPLSPLIFFELCYLMYYQFILRRKLNDRAVAVCIFINALLMLAVWLCKIF